MVSSVNQKIGMKVFLRISHQCKQMWKLWFNMKQNQNDSTLGEAHLFPTITLTLIHVIFMCYLPLVYKHLCWTAPVTDILAHYTHHITWHEQFFTSWCFFTIDPNSLLMGVSDIGQGSILYSSMLLLGDAKHPPNIDKNPAKSQIRFITLGGPMGAKCSMSWTRDIRAIPDVCKTYTKLFKS